MVHSRHLASVLGCLSTLASLAPAGEVEVNADGQRFSGVQTLRLPAGGTELELTIRGASRRVSLENVLSIVMTTSKVPDGLEESGQVAVLLRDGSRLRGRLLDGEEDLLTLETLSLGVVAVPMDVVRAAVFGGEGVPLDPSVLEGKAEEDVVYRRGPVEGDILTGILIRIGSDGVSIDCDLGELEVPIEEVLGITVAELEGGEDAVSALPVDLELVDGSSLSGSLHTLSSDQAVLDTLFRKALIISLEQISQIRFTGGRYVYLSDVDPVGVVQEPYIGTADDFLFPWRRDRTVTGRALNVNGQRFGKGLGVHSRTLLTYALGGEYERFTAWVGISDEIGELDVDASVAVLIRVDDELRYMSDCIVSGEAARRIEVDLRGGQQLVVEVDYGAGGDVGDRVVIGDPVLMRSK